ncbi:MAG: hypothetical protein KAJ33_07925 [Thermoplasmata archaeon]|nr:hypothetical protein [Thermoplasmata archaeon]
MGVEKLNRIAILKSIFRPTWGKLLAFTLLFFLVMVLPIYPVQADVSIYQYSESGQYIEPELLSQHTEYSRESFILILMNDFEWFETDIVMGSGLLISELIEYEYTADISLAIPIYLPLTVLAFIVGCFLGELYKWSRKDKDSYERDVHLWKPVKES